ncbi:DUF2505 domain-containing protein [Skermania piniformis]|uniref:DUF2505 domain-containing protein n=1 Tax=Skermania pinensis TaxID=39122 RepID=A0ABX8SCN3_9ACTN|nr:DUF2505 domain-containing protein [Skermania piniformis]QXQ14360.1 DUF2505 domain-containing protein [Skermania piniformis]
MGTSFAHNTTFDAPVTRLYAAMTSEQYWHDRMAEVGGPGARIVSFAGSPPRIEVVQVVDQKYLPDFVTRIRSGNLEIHRTETWSTLGNNSATDTFTATVPGTPAKIDGSCTLRADGNRTAIELHGRASVSIPLLGGRIEAMIAQQLTKLAAAEDEFTRGWLTTHH